MRDEGLKSTRQPSSATVSLVLDLHILEGNLFVHIFLAFKQKGFSFFTTIHSELHYSMICCKNQVVHIKIEENEGKQLEPKSIFERAKKLSVN